MSRIGKKIIEIPDEVEVKTGNNLVVVKGPKGTLNLTIPDRVKVACTDKTVSVSISDEKDKHQQMLWGTIQRLITNQIIGVTQGFEKRLNLVGVGYRANVSGQDLVLEIGCSHPVKYLIKEGVSIKVEGNTIIVSGIDKEKVGQTAAEIRAFKKPEPYKGKGIHYEGEVIRRKAGKQVAGAAAGVKGK